MLILSVFVIILIFHLIFRHSNHNNLWSTMVGSCPGTAGSSIPLASRAI